MGNCQAVEAAALVIQHPNGKVERMYWCVKAREIMKLNPGHYVSLIIPLPNTGHENNVTGDQKKTVRYTRVKLLGPTDMLVLGHAYRLLTSQEVKKVLRAKKLAKEKINEKGVDKEVEEEGETEENEKQGLKEERKIRSGSMNSRSKTWRPSLHSISEAAN